MKKKHNIWQCDKCLKEIKLPQDQKPMKGMKCSCGGEFKFFEPYEQYGGYGT